MYIDIVNFARCVGDRYRLNERLYEIERLYHDDEIANIKMYLWETNVLSTHYFRSRTRWTARLQLAAQRDVLLRQKRHQLNVVLYASDPLLCLDRKNKGSGGFMEEIRKLTDWQLTIKIELLGVAG